MFLLIDLYLERFFQTDHAIREIDFRLCGDALYGTVMDTNLTALAELCYVLDLVGLLIVYPACIRTCHVASETTGAFCVIDNRTHYTPVRCDEQILGPYGSRSDSAKGHFSVFRDIKFCELG
jgi:hypothetical protein